MRVGAIDVGTNSVHLLIADIAPDGAATVVEKAREQVAEDTFAKTLREARELAKARNYKGAFERFEELLAGGAAEQDGADEAVVEGDEDGRCAEAVGLFDERAGARDAVLFEEGGVAGADDAGRDPRLGAAAGDDAGVGRGLEIDAALAR